MKHTKGPWELFITPSGNSLIRGPKNERVATVSEFEELGPDEVISANAKLIAAAPEMLEALETVERLTTDLKMLTGVRAAIKKAKGTNPV